MNTLTICLLVICLSVPSFCLGYLFRKSKEEVPDASVYADKAIDTLHHCLSHDSDYRGFKTRMDIARWIEDRRNKVKEALNHG